MPANLNALIRYKTIDSLLGTGRKYTLDELIEHCSEAIAEAKGENKSVSKRTIQDDIRIMRSDILGFKAPIRARFGKYFYSDRDYSIFTKQVTNADILHKVYDFLFDIRDAVDDHRLDRLLVDIGDAIPGKIDDDKRIYIREDEKLYTPHSYRSIRFSVSSNTRLKEPSMRELRKRRKRLEEAARYRFKWEVVGGILDELEAGGIQ